MRVALLGGAYTARSVIAEAQRAVNVYAEENPKDAPVPVTHYPTVGLTQLGIAPIYAPVRGLYPASNGQLYGVIGPNVYAISDQWQYALLGTITAGITPVSMVDNGTTLILVDGTPSGYQISLSSNAFSAIGASTNSPPSSTDTTFAFYGANRAEFLDTFIVLNQPGSANFYSTYSNEVVFDATYFAAKRGFSDFLVSLVVITREIWLIGQRTTEIWYDAGNSNFPFAILPGPFIQHGCIAVYSVAKIGPAVFWLSQDFEGTTIVLRGAGYDAKRISTHAIEYAISKYATVSDAVGFTYQIGGHAFYVLTFPTADRTWAFDETSSLWHEWGWFDNNGVQHRARPMCSTFAYGKNIAGDWQNGNIYLLDPTNYTDNGQPVVRIRSFPHILDDGKRVVFNRFIADMEVGTAIDVPLAPCLPDSLCTDGELPLTFVTDGPNPQAICLDGATPSQVFDPEPGTEVSLRWSDTRGASWNQKVYRGLGASGDYLCQVQWRRLGMARDRVFELQWSAPVQTALNGAFIDVESADS